MASGSTHTLAALLCALTLAMLLPIRPAAAQDLPWRDKGSPFGMVTAIANRVRADEIDAYVGLLHEAGVQWTREEIFWHEVQKDPGGPFRWSGNEAGMYDYDRSISALTRAGIRIMGLLDYNPAWFQGQAVAPDAWIEAWGDYVYQVVAHYGRGGPIKHWEIWNEPNLQHFGADAGLATIADYARVLNVAHAAAKAADPEAQIVLGGLAAVWEYPPSPTTYDYFDYLEALGQLGAWNDFDILAIHPYRADPPEGAPWRRDQSTSLLDELHRLDGLLLRYGPRPVWLTEIGWSTSRTRWGVSEDQQAQFLARFYVMAIAHPSVEKIFWYDFRDDSMPVAPYDQPTYDDYNHELHFGVLRRGFPLDPGNPALRKPGFLALRAMTGELAGLWLAEVAAFGTRRDMPATYWYRFAGERRVDVLWNTDSSNQFVQIPCSCREALVRYWNGGARYLIYPENGVLNLQLDEQGAPVYVEYDRPPAPGARVFPVTAHGLRGAFLSFWERNGGLERFGYPLTEEIIEPEAGSGRPRLVQYFERARFEYFPEHIGTPYEVQLGLLGEQVLRRFGIDWQTLAKVSAAPPGCRFFPESGHNVCPPFLERWSTLGAERLVGLPLSEPFQATRPDTGQPYTVQYFQRGRLESFPEHAGTPYEVQFGLLGRELLTRWP